jgi:hypothetical protein
MTRPIPFFIVILSASVLAGCAARQKPAGNWQLRGGEGGLILVPPQPAAGPLLELKKARSASPAGTRCDMPEPPVGVSWRGRTARVAVAPGAVSALPQVTVVGPTQSTGEPARDLAWWPQFRARLAKRQEEGCLARAEAERLVERIIQGHAMPPSLAYKLRYGDYLMAGYIDLGPEFALKAVAPLRKAGVAGYETSYYDVRETSGGHLKIVLRSVEETVGGTVTRRARPAKPIALAGSARQARLFFRSWRVSGDYKIALLAASEAGWLEAMTSRFETDPERFCRSADPKEASCLAVPADTMLTAEMKVRVNGKAAYVPVGGGVGDVLRAQGVRQPAEVVSRLSVLRPYEGALVPVEFDRSRMDILYLTLVGGEVILW